MSEKMRVEQKSWTKTSIVRVFFFVILIVIQFAWIFTMITSLEARLPWLSTTITFGAMILTLTIFARHMNASYRMFWMMVVMALPMA